MGDEGWCYGARTAAESKGASTHPEIKLSAGKLSRFGVFQTILGDDQRQDRET